jgi:hypothetical protein
VISNSDSATIDDCTREQLRALLTLAASGTDPQLSFLAGLRPHEELVRVLGELCQGTSETGETLLTALSACQTPLDALRGIKELAKTILPGSRTPLQRAAATLLYHASIAAAFARHGVAISAVSPSSRVALYEDLASALAGEALSEIFREAADRVIAGS